MEMTLLKQRYQEALEIALKLGLPISDARAVAFERSGVRKELEK